MMLTTIVSRSKCLRSRSRDCGHAGRGLQTVSYSRQLISFVRTSRRHGCAASSKGCREEVVATLRIEERVNQRNYVIIGKTPASANSVLAVRFSMPGHQVDPRVARQAHHQADHVIALLPARADSVLSVNSHMTPTRLRDRAEQAALARRERLLPSMTVDDFFSSWLARRQIGWRRRSMRATLCGSSAGRMPPDVLASPTCTSYRSCSPKFLPPLWSRFRRCMHARRRWLRTSRPRKHLVATPDPAAAAATASRRHLRRPPHLPCARPLLS